MEAFKCLLCAAVLLIVHLGAINGGQAVEHIILDTTKENMLDWKRYPYGPKSPSPGWVEESFTNFDKGINWRSHVVCDVGHSDVNNWLWTPFIPTDNANRMYIEVTFSLRNCEYFPGFAKQCKETFSLLYYEFEEEAKDPWGPDSYKLIDVIAPDEGRFSKNDENIINTETRSIEVNSKSVVFAFRDQGACLSLLAVKVYYISCPEIIAGFANYPETPTGANLTSIAKVSGQCVQNARALKKPFNLCKADGSWGFRSGLCSCVSGYEGAKDQTECRACPVGTFKHNSGNDKCKRCPQNSHAQYNGSVECECLPGYFRSSKASKSSPCFRPPSSPKDLRYNLINSTTIHLFWKFPTEETRRDTKYKVSCDICSPDVVYHPNSDLLHQTNVLISGLKKGLTYEFSVSALNGHSKFSNTNNSISSITVVTQNAFSPVIYKLKIEQTLSDAIQLSWKAPSRKVEVFEVKYYAVNSKSNSNTIITKKENLTIDGLEESTMYKFQVRAKESNGDWGEFSRAVVGKTTLIDPIFMGGDEESRTDITVGIIVAIISVLGIISLSIFLLQKTRSNGKMSQSSDILDYKVISNNFANDCHPIIQTHNNIAPIYNPFAMHKTYIDPHTYEDPNLAVKQFAKEIDSKFITIESIIGGGEFGEVCKGKLRIPGKEELLVAIKTLKSGSSDKAKNDFLTEASIMGQFEHPNVIYLQGVVTQVNPIMILTEFMENGSLDTFLRANDDKFQVVQLIGMLRGIAYGMQYLSEMNYVHRDLAARNVLVNSQLVCKIADFGLSREILESNPDGVYTTRGGKIPVRWTAPEAIAFRKFTTSSDVWSFGIVMWEVMSYGERPYWNWSNQDVIKAIEKGYRLTAPMNCPEAIHQLMLDTWQKERSHRPSFASIVKTLDKLICYPDTLRKIANNPEQNLYTLDGVTDPYSYKSVDQWLDSIKMSRYSENFSNAGIIQMNQVVKLSLPQISDIGITLAGHQKKLISSIQAMRTILSNNMSSEGFLV